MAVSARRVTELATLEREDELAAIDRAMLDAATGAGSTLIVEGPMGIGKSRVLDEARALAERRRLDVLSARGGELEQDYPWGVVLQLFEQQISTLDGEGLAAALKGRAALAERLFSGLPASSAPAGAADAFGLVHALYWLVVNLSDTRPLAIVVDDLHWVDEPSLRFLLYLAERVSDLPVLVVGAVRSPWQRSEIGLVPRFIEAAPLPALRPAVLSPDATRQLLADAGLPTANDAEAVEACHGVTSGNPLLLRELIVALLQDADLAGVTDPALIARTAPRSLETRILPRITAMGQDALAVARAAALLGEDARLAVVAQVAETPFEAAVRACEMLMDAAVLTRADPPRFSHPMMRTVLHASIPPGELMRLHSAAATALHANGASAEPVARHLLEGSPVVEPWAAEALQAAARAAAARGAATVAMGYLRHAIGHLPPGERRASMLVDLGLLEAATGETASLERFETALAVLTDADERQRALYALGQTLYRYGRHEEAITTFRRGADLFAQSDPDTAARFEAAWACAGTFVAALAADAHRRLAELARTLPSNGSLNPSQRAILAALSGYSSASSPPSSAGARLAHAALEDDILLREQGSQSVPVFLAILSLLIVSRFEQAGRTLELVFADARRRNDALAFAEASMVRAHLMLAQGRIAEAMADAEAAIEGVELGWGVAPQVAYAVLAECHIERGELDRAEAVLASGQAAMSSGLVADALLFAARARLRVVQGDVDGALKDCDANRDALVPAGITNPNVAAWRPIAAAALHARGDVDAARALIDEELDLARDWELPSRVGAALRGRARLVDEADAIDDLEKALEILTGADAPLETARVLRDLGRRQHSLGEPETARDTLRRALALAHDCGATALETEAREALSAAGGRPRRAATTGIGALTPSERRIAELAAGGESNRVIAETLFLTKNTVEWHLRNIFKKLEVRSRSELRHALEGDD